jgi:hypothetical protein
MSAVIATAVGAVALGAWLKWGVVPIRVAFAAGRIVGRFSERHRIRRDGAR